MKFHSPSQFAQLRPLALGRARRLCSLHGANGLSHLPGQRLESGRAERGRRASARSAETAHARHGRRRTQNGLGGAVRLHHGRSAERVLAKARVPERYRHCDFENFETDNEIENASREQLAAWNRSLAQAKLDRAAFRGGILSRARNAERTRPAADGPLRRGQDAPRRRGAEGNRPARAQRPFLRLPRAAEGNSG